MSHMIWSHTLSGWPSVTDSEVNKRFAMVNFSFLYLGRREGSKKPPAGSAEGFGWVRFSSSRVSAGFGTLQSRLPWFHRAGPSTTLDKGYSVDGSIIAQDRAVSIP